MKNGKYCNGKKSLNMKPLAVLLALTLLVGCAIGGTIAWLTAETGEVANTFTVGDITITLEESGTTENKKGYDFVPGDTLSKDPMVTVLANSEDCYLFVKVTSTNNSCGAVDSIVNWTIRDLGTDPAQNWVAYTPATSEAGVTYYYRTVSNSDAAQPFYILTGKHDTGCTTPDTCDCEFKNGFVSISPEVTKDMVGTINNAKPALKFDAAAVQTANIADVNAAFAQIVWTDPTT